MNRSKRFHPIERADAPRPEDYECPVTAIAARLDDRDADKRLNALATMRDLELGIGANRTTKIGPSLPSYIHVHTTASYGFAVPGIFSVAHMIWAAHEARARSTLIIEHESVAHLVEAGRAAAVVNRGMAHPLRVVLGVEFKAPIARNDADSQRFSASINKALGQGEAAWVVGVGARPSAGLARLVSQFQVAKQIRASRQLTKLNRHFRLKPALRLSAVVGPDGNITDRQLCMAVAKARWPDAIAQVLVRRAGAIRALLNPDGPCYAPFPSGLPSYQELINQLLVLGMIPTFTAQLRGRVLADTVPLLKSWGIRGLDVAGIEPDEHGAGREIQRFIDLARRHRLALFGGSDYRGTGTGWRKRARWMSHPMIQATIARLSNLPQTAERKSSSGNFRNRV